MTASFYKTEKFRLITASLIAGIAIGAGAHVLKALVRQISLLCTRDFHATGGNYELLIIPIGGIIVTGLIVRYLFRHQLEGSTGRIKSKMAAHDPYLPTELTVAPIVASSVTLGCGGSAGSEGPIAYAGAAIGSNIGRWFGLTRQQAMVMMTCGAGAGIAAIFKAPIGGMLFTLEVLAMTLTTASVMQLILMCLASSLTCFTLSGFTPDMSFMHPAPFTASDLLPTLALGLFCGVYSAYYLRTGGMIRRRLQKMKRPLARNVVSGAILGVALFCFPALYGEGYSLMSKVINGNVAAVLDGMAFTVDRNILWALAGILLTKGIACYASNSGGGVAGDFAPTLFAGCMAGALFALATGALGICHLDAGNYALAGMAGVMAGAIRAPFMAIFITVEMSFTTSLLLPVTICAFISYYASLTLVNKD